MIKILAICNNCERSIELKHEPDNGEWFVHVGELAPEDWTRVQQGDDEMIDLCSDKCHREWILAKTKIAKS